MSHDVDVAIVGAGPTGLALACELRLAGISCRVLERRKDEPNITRAFAIHARTLELLDARGLAESLIPLGIQVHELQPVPGTTLKLDIIPSRYPMVLLVPQSGTEKLLERRALDHGAEIVRGAEVAGLTQDADGVTLTLADDTQLRAGYVVGTDGAHSAVRRLLGVQFVGRQYETHIMLADVQLGRPPRETLFGISTPEGLVLFVPFGDSWFRAIVWDRTREHIPLEEPLTLDELKDAFRRIAGDDFGMGEPRWRTRFLSEIRQAEKYRVGRVFLAGDAAHVHSPIGGQGMNTGIQDAMNLGWKLAYAVRGWAGPNLLDSYQAERHPVGTSVLRLTDTLFRLVLSGSKLGAALRRNVIRLAVRIRPVRQQIANRLSGVAIRYPSGGRAPDVAVDGGRLYEVLRAGKFVLVNQTAPGWEDRVVAVKSPESSSVMLVRPDGYLAWQGEGAADAALREWCGPSARSDA